MNEEYYCSEALSFQRDKRYVMFFNDGWYDNITPLLIGHFTIRKVNRHLGYVCKVEIDKAHRGKGHYKHMAKFIEEKAKELGFSALICTIRLDNEHKHLHRAFNNGWDNAVLGETNLPLAVGPAVMLTKEVA